VAALVRDGIFTLAEPFVRELRPNRTSRKCPFHEAG
jgi:hypothetical protein